MSVAKAPKIPGIGNSTTTQLSEQKPIRAINMFRAQPSKDLP